VIALVGCGKLGEALLTGLLRAGHAPSDVSVTDHAERTAELAERHGVTPATAEEAAKADILILAVKPQDMGALLAELAPHVDPSRHLVVTVAAGLPTVFFARRLPEGTAVVRVMPNTPALVDEAMSAISPGEHATEAHLDAVEALLTPVGKVVRVKESQLDAVTALSGSGPAYFFFLVEAMIDAGILLGLPRDVSQQLIIQTAIGSAKMLRDSGQHPVQLREAVTSPGGTTIAAIRKLEDHGVRAAMLSALEAARDRSVELAAELS
jgi:pyrroline-5-carboxylate reductase